MGSIGRGSFDSRLGDVEGDKVFLLSEADVEAFGVSMSAISFGAVRKAESVCALFNEESGALLMLAVAIGTERGAVAVKERERDTVGGAWLGVRSMRVRSRDVVRRREWGAIDARRRDLHGGRESIGCTRVV